MISLFTLKKNYIKYFFFIIILVLIVLLLSCLHTSFRLDETFSMGLVYKSYPNIIKLDSMDVHPPFYYLLLKTFLIFTTFWTRSLFIKILFSRVLSILIFLLGFYYLKKIIKLCGVNISSKFLLIIYLITPTILQWSTEIRMYSLSSTLLVIDLYLLLKYKYTAHRYLLVYIFIITDLSFYTYYFSIIYIEIFIFIYLFQFILFDNKDKFIGLFISNLISIIFYIPWIPIVYNQFILHSKIDNSTPSNILPNIISSITQIPSSKIISISFIFSFLVFILMLLIIYSSFKCLNYRLNILITNLFLNLLCSLFIILLLCKNHFQFVAIYPLFTIYVFVIVSIMLIFLSKINFIKIVRIISILLLLCFMLISIKNIHFNYSNYDKESFILQSNFNKWKTSNDPIKLTFNNFGKNIYSNKYVFASEDSLYLKSINKSLYVYKCKHKNFSKYLFNSDKNYKLVRKVFNNMYIK